VSPALVATGAHIEIKSGATKGICIALGMASYGIYILHQPVAYIYMRSMHLIFGSEIATRGDTMTLIYLIAIVLVALTLDFTYDLPMRKFFSKVIAPRSSEKAGLV
jgi:peptidoglycan/LPS O-acetylase OafA/YrhL